MEGGSSFSATVTRWTAQIPGDNPTDRRSHAGVAHAQEALLPSQAASGADATAVAGVPCAGLGAAGDGRKETGTTLPASTLPAPTHPRSEFMRRHLPDPQHHFLLMAKVGGLPLGRAAAQECSQQGGLFLGGPCAR